MSTWQRAEERWRRLCEQKNEMCELVYEWAALLGGQRVARATHRHTVAREGVWRSTQGGRETELNLFSSRVSAYKMVRNE